MNKAILNFWKLHLCERDWLAWGGHGLMFSKHNFIRKVIIKARRVTSVEPASLCCLSQQLLRLFFPSPVRIALDENPPYKKKSWKLRTGKWWPLWGKLLSSWALLLALAPAQRGLHSLPSREFQLTCWECPKWVTAFNSIGAICCPLGCFGTAAWLWTQLVTGNVAIVWLIFKKWSWGGVGGGGGERERGSNPIKKDGQLNFSALDRLGWR